MDSINTQEQLYKMLEELKTMARCIPSKYQQRLPYDVLSSLAQVLLNSSTVFDIVKELLDLQRTHESHLHEQREIVLKRHKVEKDDLVKSYKLQMQEVRCKSKTHMIVRLTATHKQNTLDMEKRHLDELEKYNQKILQILDEQVVEQQSVLQQTGVPCFFVTKNPVDIKLQMYILQFILKLDSRLQS